MCLITSAKEPLIADSDISCIKVLCKYNGKWVTPWMLVDVDDDVIDGNKAFKSRNEEVPKWEYEPWKHYLEKTGKGHMNMIFTMIHTFDLNMEDMYVGTDAKMFHCVIPKGTEYYKGINNDYASKEIRFVSDVSRNKQGNR